MGDVLEAELLDAFRNGRVLDCADDGARRGVDAALLRRCCLELRDQIDPHGVRLKSAEVLGGLDLTGLDVPFPLRFEACGFESAPRQQAELAADAGYLDRVLDTGHARARDAQATLADVHAALGNGLRQSARRVNLYSAADGT